MLLCIALWARAPLNLVLGLGLFHSTQNPLKLPSPIIFDVTFIVKSTIATFALVGKVYDILNLLGKISWGLVQRARHLTMAMEKTRE